MKLKILGVKQKNFQGDDGEDIGYYWYTAKKEDGFVVKFGSPNGEYKIGEDKDLNIMQDMNSRGKPILKEVSL